MADTAQHEAGRVADEVRGQVVNLTDSAREQLHDQAQAQTSHLGEAIGGMGERIQALADGRPEEAGQAQELAQSIADQVKDVSGRIDQLGFDGAIDELQRYARRRPGAFLAGAAVLGFAAARLAQGARAAGEDGTSTGQTTPSTERQSGWQQSRSDERDTASTPPSSDARSRTPGNERGDEEIVLPELATERMQR